VRLSQDSVRVRPAGRMCWARKLAIAEYGLYVDVKCLFALRNWYSVRPIFDAIATLVVGAAVWGWCG